MLQTIVFITGGAILALELLASRILTPYFGVSLYIWSGILSITLISLALGYSLGGRLASSRHAVAVERLLYWFALMPAIAAFAIVAACLAYPYLFYQLARFDLIFGAFVACVVLLFVPLLATSAMNPLLVAILLRLSSTRSDLADAGAGRVFFLSTIGSVAGVLVTAFCLIPYMSNFAAALVVAATLAALPLAMLCGRVKIAKRRPLAITGASALVLALALLTGANAYTERMWPVAYAGNTWTHEASYRSLFGTVKVLKSAPRADGGFLRMYFQDGLIQNNVDSNNHSMSFYTYALEALSFAYRPEQRSALVLGMGAGMVPMRLAQRGVAVTTVDIDPASLQAATDLFGFDARKVRVHQADARTFLKGCNERYDVVAIDLFHGDGVPDYLVTRDFFRDIKRCLANGGIAVFNTFADREEPRAYAHFLITLRSELPYITLYRPGYVARHVNSFIVAGTDPLPSPETADLQGVPARYYDTLGEMMRNPIPLDQNLLDRGQIITDARNTVSRDIAESQLTYRRHVVESIPPAFLVN